MNEEQEEEQSWLHLQRRYDAQERLRECDVTFEDTNHGSHLVVQCKSGDVIDFWPASRRFSLRKCPVSGLGVERVITIATKEIDQAA